MQFQGELTYVFLIPCNNLLKILLTQMSLIQSTKHSLFLLNKSSLPLINIIIYSHTQEIISCSLGSRTEQRISVKVNRGRDCELDVSGRAKANGRDDLYKHVMVGTFPSWSFSLLPASHDGVVNLFWPCCVGYFHPTEFFDWQNDQQVAGICGRYIIMRSVHDVVSLYLYGMPKTLRKFAGISCKEVFEKKKTSNNNNNKGWVIGIGRQGERGYRTPQCYYIVAFIIMLRNYLKLLKE